MKVLVTGGAGFIGSHLVGRVIDDGHNVTVIDNCSTGSEANLEHVRDNKRLTFLQGSVLDALLVENAMQDVELVYHLAAAVGVHYVVDDPLWTIVTNTRGTENVLRAANAVGARVVFASTSEIYGASEDLPFKEDGERVLGPTWIPRWSYSTSKAVDEHLCFAFAQRGLEVSILRYFNIFGPRMDPEGYGSVIARFLTQALTGSDLTVHGDGEQTRCFTYVTEAVEATVLAGTLPQAIGQVYNIGSNNETSINDLASTVIALTGAEVSTRHVPYEEAFGTGFYDTRRRVPDVSKAARELEWHASIDLTTGLRRILETWQVQR